MRGARAQEEGRGVLENLLRALLAVSFLAGSLYLIVDTIVR